MLTGVVLAGGPHLRMQGRLNALLPFGDSQLITLQLQLMKPVCSELIVVTNDPKPYLRLLDEEIRIITDFVRNRGPLGGMHAGFSLARNRDVWIVGSHMPFISAKAAELLQEKKHEGFDAALPWVHNGVYPLHGVYDRSCADRIWHIAQKGEPAMTRLLKEINWGGLDETAFLQEGIGLEFVNGFHTLEEYEQMLETIPIKTTV